MFKQYFKRLSAVSPRAAIIGALIIVVVVSGVALLLTRGGSEANANPAMQPRAARLDRVDGSVGVARAEAGDKQLDWAEGTLNMPVSVGDRVYTRDYAHASIALSGHNFVRLNPTTSFDVLALEDRRTQFALRSGSALFDVGVLGADHLYEVATPCGAVDFKEPGLYQIGMEGDNAIISVLNGRAQVVGQEGSGYITKGQVLTLAAEAAAEALASSLAPSTAGDIVDDYYRYRYPKVYNGRYRDYDDYLANPSYYDPYRNSVSYQYLPADIPGLYDLDYYGDWVDVSGYGYSWAPRVSAGWAPFRSGYWDLDDLWGPSWVSSEPWGWAPYHYGRWAFVNQRWFWVPVEVRTLALYSPAPVAFIPWADQIAWVPLAPGEVYVARYYDDFRPRYLASAEIVRTVTVQNTFVNFNAPGGITVVPVRSLTRVIDPSVITTVDAGVIAKSRPVIDPFSVDSVRELAIRHDDARRRIKFERQEQEALSRQVFASTTAEALPARGNLAKGLRVEEVPEKKRANKLKINETSQVTSVRRADGLPQPLAQSQKMSELATRAAQGDKSARREMRQLMRDEQRSAQQQPPAVQQAQQEQLRQQMKQQPKAERQQQATPPPQQERQVQQQQQMKQQRRLERQQQSAAATQQAQQQQQMKQQRRVERQQQSAAQQAQQQQQMKQQRKVERQQQQMRQQQQQQQVRPQQKEPKRRPPEALLQQQQQQQIRQAQQQTAARQSQMVQQREQFKAQRRAEQQQRAMSEQMNRRAAVQAAQQTQAREQQKAQRRAEQQQMTMQRQQQMVIQQQQQAAQRRAASPPAQRAPAYLGPPVRQDAGSQSARKAEKAQRKPHQ